MSKCRFISLTLHDSGFQASHILQDDIATSNCVNEANFPRREHCPTGFASEIDGKNVELLEQHAVKLCQHNLGLYLVSTGMQHLSNSTGLLLL